MPIKTSQYFLPTDFFHTKTVIAAVSGGSDSLALLFLLRAYLNEAAKYYASLPRLIAVTVDHRLRPESGCEVAFVEAVCAQYKIHHHRLEWRGEKPSAGLSAKARLMRYYLLAEAAAHFDARVIMTGHTLNDQVETYFMRAKRGAGRGLAAIPRESILMGRWRLIRPLLGLKRTTLRAYLQHYAQGWVEDPSNQNLRYERVRMRQTLTDAQEGEAMEAVALASEERRVQAQRIAHWLAQQTFVRQGGQYQLYMERPTELDRIDFLFALGLLASIIGGKGYAPRPRQLIALDQRLQAERVRFSFFGAVIDYTPTSVRFWRENRHQPSLWLEAGALVLWDGRYEVENHEAFPVYLAPIHCLRSDFVSPLLKERGLSLALMRGELAILSHKGVDFPLHKGDEKVHSKIVFRPIFSPFHWLFSKDDSPIVEQLVRLFGWEWETIGKKPWETS
ncbi:tRNA lysidine(34) synthetase TilS [Bartonella sp. DGB2]|uniref:tRNA lysidine(34) synthetase TilS n=1 Tax=Bartonella sp. DGB2 TaxID=3388426 RepID=UPI00399002E0